MLNSLLENKPKKIMNDEEMISYINSIGRCELYDELEDLSNKNYSLVRRNGTPDSRYLKAIRVSLVELGYDEDWVEGTFRDALRKRYYNE